MITAHVTLKYQNNATIQGVLEKDGEYVNQSTIVERTEEKLKKL